MEKGKTKSEKFICGLREKGKTKSEKFICGLREKGKTKTDEKKIYTVGGY